MSRTQTSSLFTLPFTHATDFTELADHCEHFAHGMADCDEPQQKMALCGRLSACLALLQPTLNDPIPDYLKASFTVEDIPAHLPAFEPDAISLAGYCQALTGLLMGGALAAETETVIAELLCELVDYFADTIKAPRWLKTGEETIALDSLH
jgi:hypothetical protein